MLLLHICGFYRSSPRAAKSQPSMTSSSAFVVRSSPHRVTCRVARAQLSSSACCLPSKEPPLEEVLARLSRIHLTTPFIVECLCKTQTSLLRHAAFAQLKDQLFAVKRQIAHFSAVFTFQNETTSAQQNTIVSCYLFQLCFLMRSKHLNHKG